MWCTYLSLEEYINSYDKKWKSAKELYFFADSQRHDPVDEFDKKWIRESIFRMSELFLHDNVLSLEESSATVTSSFPTSQDPCSL